MTARPCAKVSTNPATARASLSGRTRSTPSARRPRRSGEGEEQSEQAQRACRCHQPSPLDAGIQRGVAGQRRRVDDHDEHAEQQQHGHQVEHALQDDGRECGRRGEPLPPGEQKRPNHLPGAGRQEKACGKTNDRGFESGRKPGRPNGRQQILPTQGAERIGQQHRQLSKREQPTVGVPGFGPHGGEIHPAEEVCQQPDRQQEDEGRTKSGPHEAIVGIRIRLAG